MVDTPEYKRICVEGDMNDGGGIAHNPPQHHTYLNDKLVLVDGTPVAPHHEHGGAYTANGSGMLEINGMRVNVVGDVDTCSHVRI